MGMLLRYYKFSLIFTAACFGLGLWYGIATSDSIGSVLQILWICLLYTSPSPRD